MGVEADQLDALQDQIDAQSEGDDDADDGIEDEDDFVVWSCNETALAVFARCSWQRVVGGDRLIATGIAGPEIESIMNMLGIPAEIRTETLDLVRHAEKAVIPLLNRDDRPKPARTSMRRR